MGKKSRKKTKSKATPASSTSASATVPASGGGAVPASTPAQVAPARTAATRSQPAPATPGGAAAMFGGLGGMTPPGMPAFTFGGGEGGFDLSAAGLFGGAGAGGYNPTIPTPAASSSAGTSNNSKSKSKSAKKTKSATKSSPTMVNEVPQEDVPSTPPTPVDPSILPDLIDGSTSEDAKAFDTDADEASLTNNAAVNDEDANDASLDNDEEVPDTPTRVPPRDDEFFANNEEEDDGTDGDDESEEDDDASSDEETDHASHGSMPSLIDGAASDPDDDDSDDDETWGSVHASKNATKEGDDEEGESNKTDSPITNNNLGGAFAPFGTGADGIHRGPMDDIQKMMSRRMQEASIDGLAGSMGGYADAASVTTNGTTSATAGQEVEPPQVTDDEAADGKDAAAANAGDSGKKKKKSKNRKKKTNKKPGSANKPTCAITDAVKSGQPTSVIDELLASHDVNALSFRSQISGHTLLQVAAMAGKTDVMEWIVKVKDADPTHTGSNGRTLEDLASTQPAKSKARSLTNWYHVELEKRAEERRRLEKVSAICVQYCAKGYLSKCKLRQLQDVRPLGPWSKIVDKLMDLEVKFTLNLGKTQVRSDFGKGWIQMKKECELVVQDKDELDIVGDAAMDLPAEAAEDDDIASVSNPESVVAERLLLTPDAMAWVKKQDDDMRVLFIERLRGIMHGDRANVRCQLRKGAKTKFNMVAKLNKRDRIICAIRNKSLMVWYVCPPRMVKKRLEDVGLSYERVLETSRAVGPDPNEDDSGRPTSPTFNNSGSRPTSPTFNSSSRPTSPLPDVSIEGTNADVDADVEDFEPEMLVDPSSNVPLKIHEVEDCDLDNFKNTKDFVPTVKLTKEEEAIVKKGGTVLLLGRSGTGKTLCVANRMLYDSKMYGSENNEQLFVARTHRLCKYVSGIFEGEGGKSKNVQFLSAANFAKKLHESVSPEVDTVADTTLVVDFKMFRNVIWDEVKGNEKTPDDLQVWTQIRSFIKGSWDAAVGGPLSKEDYLGLPRERCRLDQKKREDAYAIFTRYKVYLEEKGWKDSMDKTSELVHWAMRAKDLKLFDRIYVDEVQDITQAEIGLLFLATGREYDNLFLAGDPAQAVSQGVDFRFEEIRTLVYKMSGGKHKVERWEKLYRNFRSHEGILRVSNLILESLHNAFPGAAVKLPYDTGLTVGPRPGLLQSSIEDLARLIKANERLRILTRDEHKAKLCDELSPYAPDAKNNVWGIVEAKGLEFTDCVVVDFFSTLPEQSLQKAWKNLMLNPQSVAVTSRKNRGSGSALPLAMELELKLFYTGITRACNRLFIIETKPSQAFDAFSRALQSKTLGDAMTPDAVVKEGAKIMTADDWRKEAFDMASLAEENDIDSANFLERAIAAMEKAGDDDLVEKAKLHLTAVQNEADATVALMKNEDNYEELAVASIMAYLEAGLTAEASRACGVLCRTPALKGLARRIQNLGEAALGVKED